MTPKLLNKILTTLVVAMMLLIISCAQKGTITGGEKDEDPPYLKKSKPENYSANFDGRKVKIKFNEYYTLDKIEQTFLLTPPQDSIKPKIKVKGKWLVVKLKEKLKEDTTYTLQFFGAVKDFNEGNAIDNFQFVFSTGEVVDSFAVAGRVMDAQTLKLEEGMLVGLYGEQTDFADSSVIKYKPDYITRTDTAGRFKIENVRPGRYKVFALKDINETQRFDLENEKIAFLKTIVETKAERLLKIDSLPAGTILHQGTKGHRWLDTLLKDTVIVQDLLYTTPNNLTLFSFEEKHLIQYISERKRDLRQRILINFNKQVDPSDTVLITYVDDTLKSPVITYDYNYTRDSLMVWLRDTADINNDTLQIRVTFSTLDSLNQPTTETDTLSVKFSNKKKVSNNKDKKKTEAKTPTDIDSLFFKVKTNFNGDFDIKGSIRVEVPIIYDTINQSLIKLYECIDTAFVEDLNQKKLKAVRLDSANYRLVFKRPILGDIVWYPTDSIVRPDWYKATYSANRDTVDIQVLDSAMIRKSKFSNMLKYHNLYYMDQVQKIRDSVSTVIIDQKILKYDRPSRDTIIIKLEKSPTQGVEVSPINIDKLPEGGIEVVQDKDQITLLLRDSTARNKDTLALKFNTYDRPIHNKNHKVVDRVLKDTLFAIYKIKFQTLKDKKLIGQDTMQFVFGRPIKGTPSVSLVDFPGKESTWYQCKISDKRDTMLIVSDDKDFLTLDTINYAISYLTFDNKENEIIQTDTLQIVRPVEKKAEAANTGNKGRRKSQVGMETKKEEEAAQKNMAKATLLIEKEYTMTTDTMCRRNKIIKYDFEPGKNYMLEIDDSTFISAYNTPNLYLSGKGKIRQEDYYGQININLVNVGNVDRYPDIDDDIPPFEEVDTARQLRRKINPNDTIAAQDTILTSGQLLLCLCNDKGDIKYMKPVRKDGMVKFDYILPAEYKVIIIHDRNYNNEWDTGKYLDNIYPERTIEFPKKQTVKSKWTTEVVWRL